MKKLSLTRIRPERSEKRRLSEGSTTKLEFSLIPEKKEKLKDIAKAKGLSISLYLNLVLTGQESAPFI